MIPMLLMHSFVWLKKVIDLEKIYAQKRAEIQQADPKAQEELARRVEEDKKSRKHR